MGAILNYPVSQSIQTLTSEAVFIDWLFFDERNLQLYEPGMQLIFNSVEKYPRTSAILIEFLYQYVKEYDESRTEEFMLSVQ